MNILRRCFSACRCLSALLAAVMSSVIGAGAYVPVIDAGHGGEDGGAVAGSGIVGKRS